MLTFPFYTTANVDIVGNDNNLPFSSSREPSQADDDELILLKVAEFLKAN